MSVDPDPFRAIVERHRRAVYRAAYRIAQNADDALDVMQEAFAKLATAAPPVEVDRAGPWLLRVATNRALDLVRRRDPIRAARPLDEATRSEADAPPRSDAAACRRDVANALAALPRRQAEVVNLRIYADASFSTIAKTLGISEGAAKTHFRRGLDALRPRLARLRGDNETRANGR